MAAESNFMPVFARLKDILKTYEPQMDVKSDTSDSYYLDTHRIHPLTKKPAFFGAVSIKKNYVSFYLMPVYGCPRLLDGISDGLKKRMQGKSCFNFKEIDEGLFEELTALTRRGFEVYDSEGLI
ncbi:hypothetical protein [Paenibacillus sp. MBLB4367]|uniref:hypothetical protein n=1 Tax=Paenibacillus sp. MBLB4367 TaxID=3384767 RepID=UPI003908301E